MRGGRGWGQGVMTVVGRWVGGEGGREVARGAGIGEEGVWGGGR